MNSKRELAKAKKQMRAIYGKNKCINGVYDEKLSVTCENGIFVGKRNGSVLAFKGIPFAQPPVGELRWKAPRPLESSDTVREAYYFGPSPIQTELFSERGSCYHRSEDCLYLNVWMNTDNPSADKPVMVFIHGGSYGWGATSDPLYEGTNFIQKFDDIILVSVAYRTGIMGFMDFSSVPGGENYPDSCNLGILDQIEALKWVQKNIRAFGGNPDNVTVFGESAGGGSVSILPVLPATRGLFKRVIAESGSVALTYSQEECQRLTQMLLKAAKAQNMDDLAGLSEKRLLDLNKGLNDFNNFPMRDGRIIPKDLYGMYESGAGRNVEMIIGSNADESRYWIREVGGETAFRFSTPVLFENNMRRVSEKDKEYVDAFMEDQGDNEQIWKLADFYSELLFRIPAIKQATSHASCGGKTYMYYWVYPSAIGKMKACHAVELAYVFNNLNETIYTGDNIDKQLADRVQRMWVNFARTGNPSIKGFNWPEYSIDNRETMFLGDKTSIGIRFDPLPEQRHQIEPLMKYLFNGCYSNLDFHTPHVKKSIALALVVGVGGLLALGALVYHIIRMFLH